MIMTVNRANGYSPELHEVIVCLMSVKCAEGARWEMGVRRKVESTREIVQAGHSRVNLQGIDFLPFVLKLNWTCQSTGLARD